LKEVVKKISAINIIKKKSARFYRIDIDLLWAASDMRSALMLRTTFTNNFKNMNYKALLFSILVYSCAGNSNQERQPADSSDIVISNDTIPMTRNKVSKKAVAAYVVPINNPLLKQYFGVEVFETRQTFHFLLKMQYEGVLETDTLKIPNVGIWPVVQVKKGPTKMSCIIGFLDKDKNFKEYKMLSAKGDKLKLRVLRHYSVGRYRTEY
jgi:hypothetical protein